MKLTYYMADKILTWHTLTKKKKKLQTDSIFWTKIVLYKSSEGVCVCTMCVRWTCEIGIALKNIEFGLEVVTNETLTKVLPELAQQSLDLTQSSSTILHNEQSFNFQPSFITRNGSQLVHLTMNVFHKY